MKSRLNRKAIERWVKVLLSGEYKQVKGQLCRKTPKGEKHCCLGVVCEVFNQTKRLQKKKILPINFYNDPYDKGVQNKYYDGERSILPPKVQEWLGIDAVGTFKNPINYKGKYYPGLTDLNDDGVKFSTIARIIEREILKKGNFIDRV